MNRSFTTREKALMLILAVLLLGCCYYLLVLKPSLDSIAASEAKLSELDSEITIQQAVSAKKTQLEQQIAEAEASGTPQKTLPAYDNTKNEINELNAILADAASYNINFSEADLTDAVVRRVVDISFTCDSYHAAHRVLVSLVNCKYSCLVTDIAITGSGPGQSSSSGKVSASASITFFEKLG